MNSQKARLFLSIAAGLLFVVSTGCLPPPQYVDIDEQGDIALISFALDRSIVGTGNEKDTGPGLLQSKKRYYAGHDETLDSLWKYFRENIRIAFLNVPFVGWEEIAANKKYQELSRHTPKIIMGQDIAPGANMLTPEGINYISSYNDEKLDSVAKLFNVQTLLLIENRMGYDSSSALFSIKTSHLNLFTEIKLYQAGKGIIMEHTFAAKSDNAMSLVAGEANAKHFPVHAPSAAMNVIEQIRPYLVRQKQNAAMQAAEGEG
ncbi:MAG: hypothetical protein GF398_03690 [Chitinivibrionales bacterium]|nr:hypothetical protein [Chitinivibrionales bacterium]